MKIPEAQGFQVALGHIRCTSQVEQLISASITQQVEVIDQFFGEEFFSNIQFIPTTLHFISFHFHNTSIQFTSIHPQHFKSILQNCSSNLVHSLQYDGLVKRRSPRLRQPITTRDEQLFTAGACGRQLRYRGLLSKLRAVIVKRIPRA